MFFNEILNSVFGCGKICCQMPSSNSSYLEKCLSACTKVESILKQYNLYVETGKIDFDCIRFHSSHIPLEKVKSKVDKKYVYGIGKDFEKIAFVLFSDQSLLRFLNKHITGNKNKCLSDMIQNECVCLSDYEDVLHTEFRYLESFDLIKIDDDGKISLRNKIKLLIIRDLYVNGFVSRWHYPLETQNVFEELINDKIIECKSTLFSQQEADYYDFMLNRSKFDNGLDLRNRYAHGTAEINTSEEEHKQNYLIFLRMIVLMALKIFEDLNIKKYLDSINYTSNLEK